MNLDDHYNPAHKQAIHLQDRFHDYVGRGPAAYDPQAVTLRHEIHQLVDELERHDHPQNIENRIHIIQQQLRQAQDRGQPIANYDHLHELHSNYESLRQQMRKLNELY